MKQLLYRVIYSPWINPILLRLNRLLNRWFHLNLKLPPSGKIVIKPKGGRPFILHTNQSNYVTQLLYWNGYENFEYSEIFTDLAKQSEVFFDVGSNIGYYALLACAVNPSIQVTAFEPSRGPSHYLWKNVAANPWAKVHVEKQALSAETGPIRFFENKNTKYRYLTYNLAGEGNSGSKTDIRAFQQTEVQGVTLDTYLKKRPREKLDLIKIDTEGNEHEILKASINTLKKYRPIVVCETLFNTNEAELESLFKGLDYRMFQHVNVGVREASTLSRVTDDGIRNCFFVPAEKSSVLTAYLVG